MSSIIEIENLSIGYKSSHKTTTICSGLNAKLIKGELTCLLGSNGMGKSTLIRTICGFLPSLSGDVLFDKAPLSILTEKELALKVSVVLTEKTEIPNATVSELVGYGRSPYTGFFGTLSKHDEQIVKNSIELCGIEHKADSLVSELSDGERQKAFIAKALAQDTPLIVLDEPTAFLDLPSKVEIMQLLRSLALKSGKSVIMSTHDLDLALQMADKLWLIDPNRNLITGSPEDLLIKNSFQSIFNNKGLIFDNKTGLFKISYSYSQNVCVKGHGIEYVMLRRAFSRKAIRLVQTENETGFWIDISDVSPKFSLMFDDKTISNSDSVEKTVIESIKILTETENSKSGKSSAEYQIENSSSL